MTKEDFEEHKRVASLELDAMIAGIDAETPKPAADKAAEVIDAISARLADHASARIVRSLADAASRVRESTTYLHESASNAASVRSELADLSRCGWTTLVMGMLYIVAATTGLLTEFALTAALTDLLGYGDVAIGRAIGLAFASSLLVFEVIFVRLRLQDDPWAMFAQVEAPSGAGRTNLWRRLRLAGAAALILVLVGVGSLTTVTVAKIAPLREIDSAQKRNAQDELDPEGRRLLKDGVLFFSICILVSGGFLMAAGTREIDLFLRHASLQRGIRRLEEDGHSVSEHLDKHERPALSAALGSAGIEHLWLLTAPSQDVGPKLGALVAGAGTEAAVTLTIRAAATSEVSPFKAAKELALARARLTPAPRAAAQPRSSSERVNDILMGR